MTRIRRYLNAVVVAGSLLIVLPVVAITELTRPGRGRRIARRSIRCIGRVCGLRFEVRGGEVLDPARAYVFVPNHSSYLDIPAMLLADDNVRFLAAEGLFRIPLLAGAMRALGTEPIDRHNRASAYGQLASLAERGAPKRLVIFAQGGIAQNGQTLPFRNGAFVFAIQTSASVVPVAIHRSGDLLPPRARLAVKPGVITVEFLPPIATSTMSTDDRDGLRDRVNDLVVDRLDSGPGCENLRSS